MPVLVWQLWRFITPGLYPHEKKYAVPFTAGAVTFFLLGAVVAYVSLLPTLDLPERGGRRRTSSRSTTSATTSSWSC